MSMRFAGKGRLRSTAGPRPPLPGLHWAGLALLLALTPARAAVPEFATKAEWLRLETAHFVVVTDAGAGVGKDVARKLERFSQALGQLNPGLRSVSTLPTLIFVFRDQKELEPYRPENSENLLAFFTQAEDRNLLVINGSPEGTARSEVAFHEFVHCYLRANYRDVPLWLNEGLAQYYSTCRLTRNAAEFGKPNMPLVEWMKGREPISMEMMFHMKADAPAYQHDNGLRNQFYGQSFLLTHYLQSPSGGRAERFDRFLARLHDGGVQPQSAFREVIPDAEWAPMIAGLGEYLGRIDFEKTRTVSLPDAAPDPGTAPLSPAEALALLGALQLHLGPSRVAVAGEHFDAAAALDPGFAPARAGLGFVADVGGRPAEAEAHYARALSAAPRDPRVLDLAARGAMRRLFLHAEAGAAPESLIAITRLARERYRRSLEIDPNGLEALGGYGMSFAVAGDAPDSAAVHGLERAVAAMPSRTDFAMALSRLRAQPERSAPAEHGAGGNAAVLGAAPAATNLEKRVGDLVAQGEYLAAESLYTVAIATATDPEMRDAARDGLVSFRQHYSDAIAIELINQGLDMARAGSFVEARGKIAEARDRARSEQVKSDCEAAIVQIDAERRLRIALDLVKSDRLEEAERALTPTGDVWPDDQYRARAARALADVRGRIAIKNALALVKAGKLAEARASFQRVLGMDVADGMKDYARARIKDLDATTGAKH
jgi:tetratricopeptide (TPR) repeat protein